MRHTLLLSLCLLVAACAPGTKARMRADGDPVSRVRVLRSAAAVGDRSFRLLDTVEAKIGPNTNDFGTQVRLRLQAAERGANAIALLDTVGSDGGTRVRALALRIHDTWADTTAHCLHGGDVPEGEQLHACERLVVRDGANADAWRRLAALRRRKWDWRGERAALERLVTLAPDDATAWYALGRATRGNDEARFRAWRRAAALDPAYVSPRLALGADFAAHRARAAEALPWLEDAVRLGGRGVALYHRGRALLLLARWQEAHDAFVAAADSGGIKPAWPYAGAAYARSRAGHHADAVALWNRVLALDSNWFNAMTRGADLIRDEKAAWLQSRKAIGR